MSHGWHHLPVIAATELMPSMTEMGRKQTVRFRELGSGELTFGRTNGLVSRP